uniref:Uncharacterized protein n=1 Tax=Arundo donax TaxID=35708 RepID=A0A0A8Z3G6_ARUDO
MIASLFFLLLDVFILPFGFSILLLLYPAACSILCYPPDMQSISLGIFDSPRFLAFVLSCLLTIETVTICCCSSNKLGKLNAYIIFSFLRHFFPFTTCLYIQDHGSRFLPLFCASRAFHLFRF